ncbi:hypothetical protein ACFL3C_05280 [Patescibacteria group bacterium]
MRRFSEGDGAPTRVGRVPEKTGDEPEVKRRRDESLGSLRISMGLISEVAKKVNDKIDLVDIDRVEDRMESLKRGTQGLSKEELRRKIAKLKKDIEVPESYIERERERMAALPKLRDTDEIRLKGLQAENVNVEAHKRVIKELKRELERLVQAEK